MQSLFKNKLIVLSLIFLILITNLSSVFAADTTVVNGTTYSYPDKVVEYLKTTDYYNNDYICLGFKWVYGSTQKYYVWFFKKTDTLKVHFYKRSDYNCWTLVTNEKFNGIHFEFDGSGNYLSKAEKKDYISTQTSFYSWFGSAVNATTIYIANGDVYNSNDTIFFQGPPPIVEEPTAEITQVLAEEAQKTQIAEQLKTMIAGFLKYLIVLVISLIAFWKGWQFLSTQLKKA